MNEAAPKIHVSAVATTTRCITAGSGAGKPSRGRDGDGGTEGRREARGERDGDGGSGSLPGEGGIIGGQMGVNFFKSLHRFTVVYT